MLMLEHWKPAPGFEGLYEVSNVGRVRSVERYSYHPNGYWYLKRQRVLRSHPNSRGYPQIDLRKDGRRHNVRVHRLVAEAFLPPSDDDYVNHIDLSKANNRASNLEWISFADNVRHAAREYRRRTGQGTAPRGEQSGRAIITEEQVRQMRTLHASTGMSYSEIARRHGVGHHVVSCAVRRLTWRHVD